jgi:hypothetical protein
VDRATQIEKAFDFIDHAGRGGGTGEVLVGLGNTEWLTIRAGGPGIHSWPAEPRFQQYEVLLDHDPPRFWTKYSDNGTTLYAKVPKLLLTHHITRHGGIQVMECERTMRKKLKLFRVEMLLPETEKVAALTALSGVTGVRLTRSGFLASD